MQHLSRAGLGAVSSAEAFGKPGGLVRAPFPATEADEELGVGGSRTEPSAKVCHRSTMEQSLVPWAGAGTSPQPSRRLAPRPLTLGGGRVHQGILPSCLFPGECPGTADCLAALG